MACGPSIRIRAARNAVAVPQGDVAPDGSVDVVACAGNVGASSGTSVPAFVSLMAEPEVRLLMRADGVDEQGLLATLTAISTQLSNERSRQARRSVSATFARRHRSDASKYRPGVGVLLLNERGEVFVACRTDVDDAWQMPQGGIDGHESPRQAALRELKEEIGTSDVEVIAESRDWIYYDVPEELAQRAWGGRWRGQRQKWFVMLFKGADSDIDLATGHPEFKAWRWATRDELPSLAVSFKRELYRSVLAEFGAVLEGAVRR
jgi:putative (di)nucleoside polyphosphate hydrolase